MISDHLSLSYHDVMEVYKRPMSIRFIPRIIGWVSTFLILLGVGTTATAMDKEPVIWVQVPQWTDDWAVCAEIFQTHHVIGTLQKQIIHSEKDLIGRQHLGLMPMG